ncbi:MAG: response regulator transcription factor [Pseudobdellovibrionaceae bacterium]|nr:response regulator transcription factor [Bdellovibrionales bacterium]USN47767.1 MAG: response regulator transcription factor [Pseudobdellovibrionaceae bacterium]
MHKILIVEDCEDEFALISRALPTSSEVYWRQTVAEGRRLANTKSFDMILLDVGLPDGSGLELSAELSANPRCALTPIILITSRDSVDDKILGFTSGADDYVVKPFHLRELKARLESRIRRYESFRDHADHVVAGPLEIDLTSQMCRITRDGVTIPIDDLTPIEYKILTLLAAHPDRAFSRDHILTQVWGHDVHVFPRSVDTHVSKLRRKLGESADMIKSVHGLGYRFELSADRDEAEEGMVLSGPRETLASGVPRMLSQ